MRVLQYLRKIKFSFHFFTHVGVYWWGLSRDRLSFLYSLSYKVAAVFGVSDKSTFNKEKSTNLTVQGIMGVHRTKVCFSRWGLYCVSDGMLSQLPYVTHMATYVFFSHICPFLLMFPIVSAPSPPRDAFLFFAAFNLVSQIFLSNLKIHSSWISFDKFPTIVIGFIFLFINIGLGVRPDAY